MAKGNNDLLKQEAALRDALIAKGKSAAEVEQALNDLREARVATLEEELQKTKELHAKNQQILNQIGSMRSKLDAVNNAKLSYLDNQQAELDKQFEIDVQRAQGNASVIADLQAQYDAQTASNNAAKEFVGEQAKAQQHGKNLVQQATGISNQWEDGILGSIVLTNGGLTEMIKGMGDALKLADIMGSIIEKVAESTALTVLSFDQAQAELSAMTGNAGEYNQAITEIAAEHRAMGVGLGQAASAYGSLHSNMKGFSELTPSVQKDLVTTTAMMERFGFSAEQGGKVMNKLTKGLGMSGQAAAGVQTDMLKTAIALKMPPEQMAQGFADAMPYLSSFGKDAPKIFKKVAAASKKLGVEMSTLIGFAEQFDTFEGAASAAGKLNSILGGDLLNSYEMMNATVDERNEMLLQAIDLSGKEWEAMSRQEQMAIANAAGIQDMAEANALFRGGIDAYRDAQTELENASVSQEELEARTAATMSVTDKLQQVMEMFAVAVKPIVDGIHWLLNGILQLNDATGGLLVPALLGLAVAFFIGYKMMLMANAAKAAYLGLTVAQTSASIAGAAASSSAAAGQSAVAASTTATLAPLTGFFTLLAAYLPVTLAVAAAIIAVSFAVAMIAVSVAATIWAIVTLIKLFMEMPLMIIPAIAGLWLFAATMVGITMMFAPLAPMAAMAAVAMGLLGYGMMMMAPGMLLISGAMALFGAAMMLWNAGTFVKMMALAVVLPIFAMALLYSAIPMAIAGPLIGVASAYLGIGFAALAIGLALMTFAIPAMILVAMILPFFALSLLYSAIPLYAAAIAIAPAAILLGVGFIALGLGLKLMQGTIPTMLYVAMALPLFALSLLISAPLMYLAAGTIGIAAIMLGLGFIALGLGLKLMADAAPVMFAIAAVLPLFALSLLAAAIPMYAAAGSIGIASLILGVGFLALGLGLKLMAEAAPVMMALAAVLPIFALALLVAGIPMAIGGVLFANGAIPAALGIAALGIAFKIFDAKNIPTMLELAAALIPFGIGMIVGGLLMGIAGGPFMAGAIQAAIGIAALGLAFQTVDKNTPKMMMEMGWALPVFGLGLLIAAPLLLASAIPFFIASLFIAPAMAILAGPLTAFANAIAIIAPFAAALPIIAAGLAMLGFALPLFGFGLFMLGVFASLPFFSTGLDVFIEALQGMAAAFQSIPTEKAVALGQIFSALAGMTDLEGMGDLLREFSGGLWWFSLALNMIPVEMATVFGTMMQQFLGALAPLAEQLPMIAEGLSALGFALPVFAWGIFWLGLALSLPFVTSGLWTFIAGMERMGQALSGLDANALKSFSTLMQEMAGLEFNGWWWDFWMVSWAISRIANALEDLPASKSIAFSSAIEGVAKIKDVKPENVETVDDLVDVAERYMTVQAKMKAPDMDAFVQALVTVKEIERTKTAKKGKGKDVVLVINGRELGRAVDVHLDDKHNMRVR